MSNQLWAITHERFHFAFNDIAYRECPHLIIRFYYDNAVEFIPQVF
jgi:hypothetical protein